MEKPRIALNYPLVFQTSCRPHSRTFQRAETGGIVRGASPLGETSTALLHVCLPFGKQATRQVADLQPQFPEGVSSGT
ncbi:hypothetical protein IQ268_07825 [Oculatella sp. LEGE 06141]|uniref:hypothetical protein n=1 Tax=Oculatella sp. LEGE 06141 TaxID=1828648 RepID=UPI00188069EF|nr:hypothetical protein [Oculatella sp. LEGE 06141]MBE9178471.1 hypothetical protein [Oculatella sp. LEGE 06141]